MERQRQITRTIDTAASRGDITFLPDGTVTLLEITSETVEKRLPSRVKGVPRIITEQQDRYIPSNQYETLGSLIEAEYATAPSYPGQDNGWRIEHIPEEVIGICDEWEDTNTYPPEGEIIAAAREVSVERADRLAATHACPHCPAETQYACRFSGWSRALYRYPLIEVEDGADGQKYEVPFDIALYAATAPNAMEYQVDRKIDQYEGMLSAERSLRIKPVALSRDYVIAATEGQSIPVSNELVLQNTKLLEQTTLALDNWYEVRPKYLKSKVAPEYSAAEILEALQDKIMLAYAERVDETDYNAMFKRVRQELGRRGLGLALGFRNCGMGDYEMAASAYNPTKRTLRDVSVGMDSSDIIKRLHQQLDKESIKGE